MKEIRFAIDRQACASDELSKVKLTGVQLYTMQTKAHIVYIVELESLAKQSFQLVIKFKNKSNQGIYTDKPST